MSSGHSGREVLGTEAGWVTPSQAAQLSAFVSVVLFKRFLSLDGFLASLEDKGLVERRLWVKL